MKMSQENGNYAEKEALRKLFAGGLDRNTTDETFRQHFEQFGTIVDLVIIKDKVTQQSKGFGFVTYDSSLAVKSALEGRPHIIDERTVEVKRAIPREDNTATAHQRTKKLFLGGLPSNVTEEDITNFFDENYSGHGTVEKCDLIRNRETNEVRGFAFLELSTEDMADVVIITDPKPTVCGKKIEIKKCEERGAGNTTSNNFTKQCQQREIIFARLQGNLKCILLVQATCSLFCRKLSCSNMVQYMLLPMVCIDILIRGLCMLSLPSRQSFASERLIFVVNFQCWGTTTQPPGSYTMDVQQ